MTSPAALGPTAWCVVSGAYRGGVAEPDWTLLDVDDEQKDRIFERFISFSRPFAHPPVVHAGLAGFDIDNTANARLSVSVSNIYAHGFNLTLRTWLNTRMWSVEVAWLAIGEQF